MVNQGRSTLQFPIQTTLYDANDRIVFIYGADTANTSNAVAQTATIAIGNFVNALAASLQITIAPSDPANSSVTTVTKGTIFATSSFLYVADQTNHLIRFIKDPSFT